MESYFNETFDLLGKVLNTDQMSIQLINRQGFYTFRKWRGLSIEYRNSVRNFHFWKLEQGYFEPVFIENVQTDRRVRPIKRKLHEEDINSGSSIPLVINNILFGRFSVYFQDYHEFDNWEMQLIKTAAHSISIVLESESIKKIYTKTGILPGDKELSKTIKIIHTKEKLLHEVLNIAKFGYWEYDNRSNQIRCSVELMNLLGFNPIKQPVLLNDALAAICSDDVNLMKFAFKEAIEKKKNLEVIIRHTKDNLSCNYLHIKINPVVRKDKCEKLIGTMHDISEYLQTDLLKKTNPYMICNHNFNLAFNNTVPLNENISGGNPGKENSTVKKPANQNQVLVRFGKKGKIIKTSDIEYITSMGNYTNIFIINDGKLTVRKLLKEWLEILPEDNFIRIHRSYVINLELIQDIEKWYHRSLRIKMKNSSKIFIASCRYSKLIRKKLKA